MTASPVRRFIVILCVLTLSILASSPLAAANLLANPGFDTDLSGWQNLFARTANWSAADASNNASSGSALVFNEANPSNGATPLVLTQCVAAVPLATYSLGARLRIAVEQPEFTAAYVIAQVFATGNCSGAALQQVFSPGSTAAEWQQDNFSFTADAGAQSIRLGLGVFKPTGVTAPAAAHYDDVFLEQGEGSGGFLIGPSISASWYNPAQSGHGIMIHLINATQAWMCWFTFDLGGNRAWICALGTINGDTLNFANAFTVSGGKFPPLFDPLAIVEVPWGSITVTFTSCDAGSMQWTTSATGFQSGSMPLSRLTTLWGHPCP